MCLVTYHNSTRTDYLLSCTTDLQFPTSLGGLGLINTRATANTNVKAFEGMAKKEV